MAGGVVSPRAQLRVHAISNVTLRIVWLLRLYETTVYVPYYATL